jgi:hypothetical protein
MNTKARWIIPFLLLAPGLCSAQTYGSGPLPDNITTPCNASYIECVTTLQDLGKEQAACVTVLNYLGAARATLPLMSELEVRVFLSQRIPFPTVDDCNANLAACYQTVDQYSAETHACYKQLKKALKVVR